METGRWRHIDENERAALARAHHAAPEGNPRHEQSNLYSLVVRGVQRFYERLQPVPSQDTSASTAALPYDRTSDEGWPPTAFDWEEEGIFDKDAGSDPTPQS